MERLGVRYLAVFGSVARDQASRTSDIDVLVEMVETPSLFELLRLKHALTDLLQHNVDLVPREDIRPQLKEEIEREAIRVI